jgi:hypothetical protein
MVRELRKGKHGPRLRRRIGGLVVTITDKGVYLRGERRRESKSVFVSWEEIAKKGLQNAGYSLLEKEWAKPLEQLWRLSELPHE